jgi:tetratricopeptide (TPR) repeat protein
MLSLEEVTEFSKDPKVGFPLTSTSGNPFLPDQFLSIHQNLSAEEDVQELEVRQNRRNRPESEHAKLLFQEQIRVSKKALARSPANPYLLNNLGVSYLNAGQIQEAFDSFTKALSEKKGFIAARLNLAKAYLLSDNLNAALDMYKELVEQCPNEPVIHMNLAELYLRLAKADKFNEHINKCENHLKEIVRTESDGSAVHNNLGIVSLLKRDFKSAIAHFRKALAENPRASLIHFNMGVAYYYLAKNVQKAARHFSASLALDPYNLDAVKSLARAYQALGEYENSVNVLKPYSERAKEDVEYLELLACSYYNMREYKDCLVQLRSLLQRVEDKEISKKRLSRVYNNIGCAYLGMNEITLAEQFFNKSITVQEAGPNPFFNLIEIYLSSNKLLEAKGLIERVEALFPTDGRLPFVLGKYYLFDKEYDQAMANFHKAARLMPADVRAYAAMSCIASEVKCDYEEAIGIIKAGIQYSPTNLTLLNNLAYNYLMADKVGQARAVLDSIKDSTVSQENVYLTATRGLLLIKEHAIEEGAHLYNRALKLAAGQELKNRVRQKKYLELGRYYLKENQVSRGRRILQQVLSIHTSEDHYAAQARTLLANSGVS